MKELGRKFRAWGFNVVPIRETIDPNGTVKRKMPVGKWGHLQGAPQTDDDFEKCPWDRKDITGVGLLSGPGGFRCIDIDKSDDLTLVAATLSHLGLPEKYQWTVKSGSGFHIWFKFDAEYPITKIDQLRDKVMTSKAKPEFGCDHLELRFGKCLTLAAGSLHSSGKRYEWHFSEPEGPPSPVTPGALKSFVNEVCVIEKTKSEEALADAIEAAKAGGSRNEIFYALACKLKKNGVPRAEVERVGRAYQTAVTGLKDGKYSISEMKASLKSAFGKETNLAESSFLKSLEKDQVFTDQNSRAIVKIVDGDHSRFIKVNSKLYRSYLIKRYHQQSKSVPSKSTIENFVQFVEAKAIIDGEKIQTFSRMGWRDQNLYFDLANERSEVVEISERGWNVVTQCSVPFLKQPEMLPIATPVNENADWRILKKFFPFSDDDLMLIVAWLGYLFTQAMDYPILQIVGGEGSGKSTWTELLRAVIDPNNTPHQAMPRDEHDLITIADSTFVIALNNVTEISDARSDSLARLATGAGFGKRAMYQDAEVYTIFVTKPIIINSIHRLINRSDLLDRAITIEMPPMADDPKGKLEMTMEMQAAVPLILGGLLDLVVKFLKEKDSTDKSGLSRMADFHFFGRTVFGERFDEVYEANRAEQVSDHLSDEPLVGALTAMLYDDPEIECSPKELWKKINSHLESRDECKSAAVMGKQIARLTPSLEKMGVRVRKSRNAAGRIYTLSRDLAPGERESASTVTSTKDMEDVGDGLDGTLRNLVFPFTSLYNLALQKQGKAQKS